MLRFAEYLALRGLGLTTQKGYYREIRLLHEFQGADPVSLDGEAIRRYLVHRKCVKRFERPWIGQQALRSCRQGKKGSLHAAWQRHLPRTAKLLALPS